MYHAVIMSGGAGSRLWPLTRQALPKQFLRLTTEQPLIGETVARLRRTVPPERIWIVTGRAHEKLARDLLPELPEQNIIAEPIARNTTGAVGLAMARLLRHDPDAVFSVFPSDHLMANAEQFDAAINLAARLATGETIVCIGVTPRSPETGLGYVERGDVVQTGNGVVAYRVARFVEKPDAERAELFLRAGTFFWNAGIFTWRADGLRNLLERHLAGSVQRFVDTDRAIESDPDAALRAFAGLPNISIDYAVLEKAAERLVVEADLGWRDIGDWSALHDATAQKDEAGNVVPELSVAIDTRGSYFSASRPKLIAAIGVENLVVVDTDDALLICRRDRTQEVRQVVDQLKQRSLDHLF